MNEMPNVTFGGYLKQLRSERRLSLREFCTDVGVDPSNYSKIERGAIVAPKDERLEPYRCALGLESDSPEWREALRLAALSRSEIPPAVLSDELLMAKLPVLFRTLEGDPVDDAALDELVAMLRRE